MTDRNVCPPVLQRSTSILAKLLVGGLLVVPLAAMLFPELSSTSGNTSGNSVTPRRKAAPAMRTTAADPALVPFAVQRSGR